ncbi:MAG: MMPL family transporter, partial [Myxococcales bacterium]|nr:MMPL family transporter [Myxococcales bacterium]
VVMFALLYTLILVPIAFSYLPPLTVKTVKDSGFIHRMLVGTADLAWKHHRPVVIVTVLIGLIAALGIPRTEVGADFQAYFHDDDPVGVDARFVDQHLGGTITIEVVAEADDVRQPEVLRAMERARVYLQENPAVGTAMGSEQLVRTLNERYMGDPEAYVIPDTLPRSAQLLELIIGDEIYRDYFSTDARIGRLSARVNGSEYRQLGEHSEEIEAYVVGQFDGLARAEMTGLGKLILNLDSYILSSQIRSILVAFITIGLMICLMFRSLRFGFYALIPNATPLLIIVGAMGWLRISLDVATVMIGSIMLGLIVDDTVHFLARLRLEERAAKAEGRNWDLRTPLYASGVGTGRALLTTSIILAAAFWTNLAASFKVNQNFGLLSGIAVCLALVCDLLVLPAVIRWLPLRKEVVFKAEETSRSTAADTATEL